MAIHNITLQVIFFKEDAKVIAYAPALDLSACGDNLEDAKKGFDTVVKAFFEELIKMGTLEKVLHTLGWRKKVRTWAVPQQRNMKSYSSIPLHILKTIQVPVHFPACC